MGSFRWDAHCSLFFRSLLGPGLPIQYITADTQRLTLVYFCVTGLDLLGKLGSLSGPDIASVRKWVLAQQVHSTGVTGEARDLSERSANTLDGGMENKIHAAATNKGKAGDVAGFVAARSAATPSNLTRCEGGEVTSVTLHWNLPSSPTARCPRGCSDVGAPETEPDEGNLAMTYSALATLVTLGDNIALLIAMEEVDGDAILQSLRSLQRQDGSFQASASDSTCDLRFTYCACAVSSMLVNWDGVDREKTISYIDRCYPAGSTYCAVASMELMGVLDNLDPGRREGLVEWCVNRQGDGFQSRPNKLADSCCSFWVGATLALLGELHLVDRARARRFHISCQNKVLGGFAKAPGMPSDLLHSFYSISWLSLAKELGVEEIDVSLGITKRARALFPL